MTAVADRVLLNVANRAALQADVVRAVQDVRYQGSMESAPKLTLVIQDPDRDLLNSRLLVRRAVRALGTPEAFTLRPIDLIYQGIPYQLSAVDPEGAFITLDFEHRGVAYMRRHDHPISASRAGSTRAMFIRRQVREVGRHKTAGHRMAFWAPEVRTRQPVAAGDGEALSSRAEPERDPVAEREGARAFRGLKIKGVEADAEQRRNMAVVDAAFASTGAGQKATLAGWCAAIGESAIRVVRNMAGSKYSGVFQADPANVPMDDTAEQARCFQLGGKGFQQGGAIKLARENPGMSPGEIATRVEAGGKPASFYDEWRPEAEAIMVAGSGVSTASGGGGSYVKPFQFRRDEGQDAWENTGELAEKVNRRRFVTVVAPRQDVFIYAGDPDLMKLRPQARFAPTDPEVVSFDAGLTMGKTARVARAVFLPGKVDLAWGLPVMVDGGGVEGGKWLVWDWAEASDSGTVEVELRQPQPVRPEPASEIVRRDGGSPGSEVLTRGGGEGVEAVVEAAKAISDRNYPYAWGGGHPVAGRPSQSTRPGESQVGYDCSGYVGACLLAGGMFSRGPVPGSGWFATSWGKPGRGEDMTVWANPQHIFIEFHGRKIRWADTSRQAGGPSGPHVRYGNRSTEGFTARHWGGGE